MQAPLPSDFEAVVIDADDTIAEAFIKLIRFSVLVTRWYFSWYNADGSFSEFFRQRLCEACGGTN